MWKCFLKTNKVATCRFLEPPRAGKERKLVREIGSLKNRRGVGVGDDLQCSSELRKSKRNDF